MSSSAELLPKLHDLHAPIRVPSISEYQYACGEAALEIERLQHDVDTLQSRLLVNRVREEELRALLAELIDIEGPQPGHIMWANKVKAALAKYIS